MNTPDLLYPPHIADWAWTKLSHATDHPDRPFHLLTLATVSPDGRPAARLMTNRGADRSGGRVWMYTRVDTPKIADIRARPQVCLVGYDPASGVQLRLWGSATVRQHGPSADRHWEHIAAVSIWLLGLPPEHHAAAVGIDPRLPLDREQITEGLTARARAQFGVLEIAVETIDWHQATGTRQLRAVMHARDDWQPQLVG